MWPYPEPAGAAVPGAQQPGPGDGGLLPRAGAAHQPPREPQQPHPAPRQPLHPLPPPAVSRWEVHSNPVINSLKKSIHHLHFKVNRNHFLSCILASLYKKIHFYHVLSDIILCPKTINIMNNKCHHVTKMLLSKLSVPSITRCSHFTAEQGFSSPAL